jgi:hypothetical protein
MGGKKLKFLGLDLINHVLIVVWIKGCKEGRRAIIRLWYLGRNKEWKPGIF